MIVSASIRSLLRRRGRTGLALAGVTVSAALLLDMTMLASGLTRSFGTLIGVSGYALRVTPRGMLPFDSDATIGGAAAVQARIEAVAGVSAVAPVLGAQLFQVLGDSAGPAVFTLGIAGDPRFQYSLVSGRDPAPDEVVVSGAFAADARVGPGDSLRLAPPADVSMGTVRGARRYLVSGIADFIYDYEGQHTIAMPLTR